MRKKKEPDCFGYTMVCPICNKTFWVADMAQYVYKKDWHKKNSKYYCSYGCWRKDEK